MTSIENEMKYLESVLTEEEKKQLEENEKTTEELLKEKNVKYFTE
jgi:hypothetical protein